MKDQPMDEIKAKELLRSMFSDAIEKAEWGTMVNDIETYQKIKGLIISAFTAILSICPMQIRVAVQHKVSKLENLDPIFEFEELEGFLKLSQVFSTSLLSELDDKKVKDFAMPHLAVGHLDQLVRIIEKGGYSDKNAKSLGAAISTELRILSSRLEKMDWTKGWGDKM